LGKVSTTLLASRPIGEQRDITGDDLIEVAGAIIGA
jgi:hypothetical protein